MSIRKKLVIAAWEIGCQDSPFGVKLGDMGQLLEELPFEIARYALKIGQPLDIEILSPCFRFYDRQQLHKLQNVLKVPHFDLDFEVFTRTVEEKQELTIKYVYFWQDKVLGNFGKKESPESIYALNPWDAMRVYARVAAAMAAYVDQPAYHYDALHMHDYQVGLLPFYLDNNPSKGSPVVFTIHNASYQGWLEVWNDNPGPVMNEFAMPQEWYAKYFQYWGNCNTLKGILLKMQEIGATVTTVSEGYAKDISMCEDDIRKLAVSEGLLPPKRVPVPSLNLAELGWVGVTGINSGLAANHRPENIQVFKAEYLRSLQAQQNTALFRHPVVQEGMLKEDHTYSRETLSKREELRSFVHLECFDGLPEPNDVVFCTVGRLSQEKNFEVLLGCMESLIHQYPNVRFAILPVLAKEERCNDSYVRSLCEKFEEVASRNPSNICFNKKGREHLIKLVLAGSNFCIIPSKVEPCGIDYEAAVLGTIPVVRKTGGLHKTIVGGTHSYSYSWFNEDDPWGESSSLRNVLERAIEEFVHYPAVYEQRVQKLMQLDCSWDKAVEKYWELFKLSK